MYKLIIADDERIVLKGITHTIQWEKYGIQVAATAENGRELLEKALSCQPDIVLTDIRMPEFDGLTAIGRLKELLPDCEFLIITAHEEFEYAKKAIELGVSGYITKPVLKTEVIEQVLQAARKLEKRRRNTGEVYTGASDGIERAVRYMKSHVEMEVTLPEVAEYMHMNPSYFSRYFKEEMSISFMEYVKRMKIDRAKELLDTSNLKTYEISARLGYQSVQYFSTLFKNITGLTPQEYKSRGDNG